MVTIIHIIRSGNFISVMLDNGEQYYFRAADMKRDQFAEGCQYHSDNFYRTVREIQYPHALNLAVSMLARRPCSKREILLRLSKHRISDKVSELVLCKLEKENLINDEEFCRQWIRFRLSHGYGPALICRELKMKGIPEDMSVSFLEQFDAYDVHENAVVIARKLVKRAGAAEDTLKLRQKVLSSLVRKGYDWDIARSVCDKVLNMDK